MWCQAMHSDAMWPVKGEYICKTCLRRYPVAWEPGTRQNTTQVSAAPQSIPAAPARMA
jgi:hypothetical protein